MGNTRGFTLVEQLVVIALLAIASAVVVSRLAGVGPAAELVALRQEARALQDALDRWLAASPDLAAARSAFGPPGAVASAPPDQWAFARDTLAPHLAPGALDGWAAGSDASGLRSPLLRQRGAHLRLAWPADWRRLPPRVELHGLAQGVTP